ncbi:S8 family serine peptidase [Ferruginibacter lapsinanis]|uniref:S8 family serine peptidase n=1 Tax=Ferruginibacter lapsinanis TaxID=563172 RepID=UPI001E5592AC|nr:S8 family serine peptidase [Ferruginibacter lapsinanis]UEG49062.1 S8 family serine peptidase [Ferruginibacter lapsinanis]
MNKISYLSAAALLLSSSIFAQKEEVPKNWHQLDKANTGYYGISIDKAYDFVKGKKLKSKTVVVAVIDSGIDTLHEDLKPILWTNPKEIPGNGKDDDKNGYIDDVHGWNFIGGKDGQNVKEDSYEAARVYHRLKSKFGSVVPDESSVSAADKADLIMYKKAQQKILGNADGQDDHGFEFLALKRVQTNLMASDSILKKAIGKEKFTGTELDAYEATTDDVKKAKFSLLGLMKANDALEQTNAEFMEGLNDYVAGEERKNDAKQNPPKEYRKEIVKDDESNINDRYYGNNDLMASTPFHGTHCSGIIGAVRDNGKGVNGIADNVRIMMVRAVPDGDEHDKDIANAIRYAVNNGAQIISMSFGKDFSPEKQWVDDAVRYAESKGVLLVHAAGNDAKNVDSTDNFPNANFVDGKGRANTWITVGASGDPKNGGITASFSNIGKQEVDVFAPGVQIYSTIPGGNTYGNASGTSMACPVVAGTAAFLLEYFPTLSAKQLKYVIEKTAQAPDIDVKIPGTDELTKLSTLCKTGGIVNAYEAAKLAATLKGERKASKATPVAKAKTVKKKK